MEVTASEDIRIARVIGRNRCSAAEVKARIASQDSFTPAHLHACIRYLDNDGEHALLPQVLKALDHLR